MLQVLVFVLLCGFSVLVAAEQAVEVPVAKEEVVSEAAESGRGTIQFRLKDDLERSGESKSSSDIGTMVIGLATVLGLILVLAWLSKRFNLAAPGGNSRMKLISAMSVGPKEKIMLVEVEGEKLLLGVTPHQINRLGSYDQSYDVNNTDAPAAKTEFAERMSSLLKAGASGNE